MLDKPAFGGPETEIVYTYQINVVPPAGISDWQSKKIASLPAIQLSKLEATGRVDAETLTRLASKGGPSYIELPTHTQEVIITKRLNPGRYAFVRIIDAAQPNGTGLACVDGSGRPFSEGAVIDLKPGDTVYAGHIVMEVTLSQSSDPGVLASSFTKLSTAPASAKENFATWKVNPTTFTRQPEAVMVCQPWTFPELIGTTSRCRGDAREQLDKVVKVLKGNRSMHVWLNNSSNLKLPVGPEQVLSCPG
ncbi:hypothetical protein BAL199_04184 [alpha proteobacterium BAL199]|jgi:hypothetical protein|nr:hypothetical protein BAL199_04184 [alpha proteobacterium BAL199]